MYLALVDGRRVAYQQYGDPRGRPVLIIHGAWGGPSSTLWTGPRLRWYAPSDGLRLIWYDRRCAGWSEYVESDFTLADLARDAAAMLDHLNIERAAVVATSAGGPIGLRMALDFPARVSALALLNTGAGLMHPNPNVERNAGVLDRLSTVNQRLAMLDLADQSGAQAAILAHEQEWREPPQPPEEDDGLAAVRAHRRQRLQALPQPELIRLAAGALRNMRAQQEVDLTAELRAIQAPTLIVHGDADTTVPIEFGKALANALPKATFAALPGKGHGLIWDVEAQATIISWLRAR